MRNCIPGWHPNGLYKMQYQGKSFVTMANSEDGALKIAKEYFKLDNTDDVLVLRAPKFKNF